MGFYFRKSVRCGPFRVNLSRGGIGMSVGGGGFRTGMSGRGRRYTTFSVPGTGVGWRSGGRGCALPFSILFLGAAATTATAILRSLLA